jgi:hypothetical protein
MTTKHNDQSSPIQASIPRQPSDAFLPIGMALLLSGSAGFWFQNMYAFFTTFFACGFLVVLADYHRGK